MPGARPVKSRRPAASGPGTTTAAQGRAPWLDVDWQAAQHRTRDRRAGGQLLRARRGPGDRLRPRPRRLLAVVAGEHAGARARPPRGGDGPARLRLLGDAARGHLDRVLRELDLPADGRAGHRVGGGGRQLDGRLRRRRAGDPLPAARAAARRSSRRRSSGRPPARAQPLVRLARLSRRRRGARAHARHRRHRDPAAAALLRRWRRAGFRYPQPDLATELAHEMVRSARRTDGFLPALEALADYPLEEELPEDQLPDADRVGRARPRSSRSRTPSGCRS